MSQTLNTVFKLTGGDRAAMAGAAIGTSMLNAIINAHDQAARHRTLSDALVEVARHPCLERAAAGFTLVTVNCFERALAANQENP
jgi:hypothetical protein